MQDDVSRKRAILPSPAMIVAIIALVLATAGSAIAVKKSVKLPKKSVGAKQLKPKSVTTGKIANNSVKSANIVDHSLTGTDINIHALGTVPSAVNAAQTGNAGTVRHYTSVDEVEEEEGNARVWGGMHWRNSTEVGAALGRRVGRYTARHLLRRLDD